MFQGQQNITPQMQAAIQVVSVRMAIFPSSYAEWERCLDELVLMVKCLVDATATTPPIFYEVEPSTTYDPQTSEEKPRYDSDTIRGLRNALSYAARICRLELDGDEEELLSWVVQSVLKNVSKPPFSVAK